MIKFSFSRSGDQHVLLNAHGDPNFGSHSSMAKIVVKMNGSSMGGRYDRLLQQQARQMAGADAMYNLLAEMAFKLNKSSEMRQKIEELLVAVDNVRVPT